MDAARRREPRRREPRRREHGDAPWSDLAQAQAGVLSRVQLIDLGCTPAQIGAQLDAGRWTGLVPGVYATFTGPVPALSRAHAAVLHAGPGSALGGTAALWLWGVVDAPPDMMTVCIPQARRVESRPGIRVLRRRDAVHQVHPAAVPPRLRVEAALLDVADEAADDAHVVDVLLRATRGRHTTPGRLLAALAARPWHRRRRLLTDLLAEAADGVQSGLERRWLHDVERRHGLPRGERNLPDDQALPAAGPAVRRYRDVRYRALGVVVELDGREAHPDWAQFRDRTRDNAVAARGEVSLRYGWRETVADPCGIAAQLVQVLRLRGWAGSPRRCGPACPLR